MSGEVGGGWPGPGHRGFTRRGRGGSGWEQWAEALPGPWLWPRPGMGVGIPQRQAWRPVGIQTDGLEGVFVFGPGDPRTPNTPSQAPLPKMTILGRRHGWGRGAGVKGHPVSPGLVFLERLNGKCLADGRPTYMAAGSPKAPTSSTPARAPGPVLDHRRPGPSPSGHPAATPPGCAPLQRGVGDESANRGPPLGREAPGRGCRSRM